MSRNYRLVTFVCTILLFTVTHTLAQPGGGDAAVSSLNGVRLPAGAVRLNDGDVPAEFMDTLGKLAAHNGEKHKGDSEVLVWAGGGYHRSYAQQLVKRLTDNLQSSGWTYAVGEQNKDFTVFNSLNTREQRSVVGFWMATDESMIVAWTEMLPTKAANSPAQKAANNSAVSTLAATNWGYVLRVGKDEGYVNVMGSEMPPMPPFAPLKPRPGFVRGFVKDWTGKPLANAAIGVRASYFAGHYSGAQGRTDAKGYYEFAVPKGSAHFYNAGYAMDWGDGVAAIGLHPADGLLDSWVTSEGAVENFVLLPYGITSKASVQDNPRNAGSYYGGSIYISYGAYEANDNRPYAGYVPENSTIEITLASETGQNFIIHKTAGFQSLFRINNIPLGRYKISAKVNSKSLNLKHLGIAAQAFGLTPRETRGEAALTFAPETAKSEMVTPQTGSWKPIEISITMP